MNPLADIKGRKFVFLLSQGISIAGTSILIIGAYTKVVFVMCLAQVLIGFGAYATMIVGYIIISDLC
jgi:MFS family permease